MINGLCFGNAVISGCNNILNSKKIVDELNIFPVPDGDTGTNMSKTILSAAENIQTLNSVSETAKMIASAMLRGARGNSGVILSIIFRGFAQAFENIEQADGTDLVNALGIGVKEAYGTITNPTEGTILTVVRLAYEEGLNALETDTDPIFVWQNVCIGAKRALDMTPELLPVLKRAGVVDAGGKGLLLIFEGMLSVFEKDEIIQINEEDLPLDENKFAEITAEFDEEINFKYCTEFITKKGDIDEKAVNILRDELEKIGDCVLVVDDSEIVKAHVHTDNPGIALQQAIETGELLNVKIENMAEQNRQKVKMEQLKSQKFDFADPTEEFGFVCVASGEGLVEAFKDLGCTNVVIGGQTMNPSTKDLMAAVCATPAKVVYLLPNNKNVVLAAEQAAELITDRKVVVVKTKTIPQGLSAMIAFDPESDVETNIESMQEQAAKVSTGQVTFAARDSEFGGLKMKKNDIIALNNGKLVIVEKDPVKALQKLAKQLIHKQSQFVTVIYGQDIDEQQASRAFEMIVSKSPSGAEVNFIKGDQPIYHFIISVE